MKRFICSMFLVLGLTSVAAAVQVLVPDNGSGTAAMPIRADYPSQSPMHIISGLPTGSQINIDAVLKTPVVAAEQPGGSMGGTQSAGGGPLFTWNMQGVGAYAGYSRTLSFPAGGGGVQSFFDPAFNTMGASYEVHAAPRTPGTPAQSFDTTMFRMSSQLPLGDPDFDLLRVTGGTDFGMPSPGHTTLTQVGGNWNVDSFFDITYRIDFIGTPGGPFAGMSGSTNGTARFQAGQPLPEPTTLALGMVALLAAPLLIWRRYRR